MELEPKDHADLVKAVQDLENPGLAASLSNYIGKPIELAMKSLPAKAEKTVKEATRKSMQAALKLVAITLNANHEGPPSNLLHKVMAGATGAGGGALGLVGLPIEMPISTGIILRSLADIARSNGENIHDIETQLACIEVFAFGSRTEADDGAESGYYFVRAMLAKAINEAAEYIASQGIADQTAPAIVRLLTLIAARLQIQITAKVAAQLIPLVGAAGGCTINLLFINHFQEVGRGHFTVRRLERKYGAEVVREEYQKISHDQPWKYQR